MSGATARRNSLMQGVGNARRGSILGGGSGGAGGDNSPGNSPGAAAAASAAAAGWSKGGGGSGPETELEYMLGRLSASLPSQPKERQQRMVETLQAAVVEWQRIVAAEQPPAGDGDGGSLEQAQLEGATSDGGGKGRRQRKKRGATATMVVARPGDEDLGAFDALQALQNEHGWASNGADGSGGNSEDTGDGNNSESVATDSKPAGRAAGEPAGGGSSKVEGQIGLAISMGATLAEGTEEEEAGTPRDVSSSDLGALDVALEEGQEDEESDEDEDSKPLRRSRRNRASSKGVAASLQSMEESGS